MGIGDWGLGIGEIPNPHFLIFVKIKSNKKNNKEININK